MLVALIVVVASMPQSNPLKRLLTALCYRVGATVAAGLFAIPMEPIPGIDAVYDIAVPVALVWYWITLFRGANETKSPASLRKGRRTPVLDDSQHERPPPLEARDPPSVL